MTKLISTLLVLLLITITANAQQKTKPLSSGELLEKGIKLHDEQKYKDAIALYSQVNRNDSNYALALHELSLSYYSDSNFLASKNTAEIGLKYFPENKNKWLNLIANAEDELGNTDAAINLYDKIISTDKNNYLAFFNKGIVYYNKKKYEEASTNLKQALLINPFYTSAHYFLGKVALAQGKPVNAMFAFSTYLLINPEGKYNGASINQLLGIANTKEDVLKSISNNFGEEDNFSEQQEILISKIALDRKYKAKSSLDDNVVKQLQVLMEKTNFNESDKGFFNQFYVPIFEEIFKKDFENFSYFIFAALDIKVIKDYIRKNKKDLVKFSEETIIPYFNDIRKTRELEFNKRASITKQYITVNNVTVAYATQKVFGKEYGFIGDAQFFHNNGQLKSEGNFDDNGKRNGLWKFYYSNGQLEEVNTYVNGNLEGEIKAWFDNGVQSSQVIYKDNQAAGKYQNWFYNNVPRKIGNFENNKENGNLKTYDSHGFLTFDGGTKEDEYDGPFKTFFINGKTKIASTYTNGKQNGLYKEYYYNGNLSSTGNLVNSEKQGVWKEFFYSGNQKATLNYEKGELEGEQVYYHENGKVEKKIIYQKNKEEGKSEEFYEDGKIYCETIFEKGRLREMTFYDKQGKVYSNTTSRKGDATLIFYNYNGIKTSEGYFNKEGFRSGKTSFFYNNGKLRSEETYKEGKLEGLKTTYYKNGTKASEVNYKEDKEDGYYVAYNRNQTIQAEGFYENGEKQGTFKYYDVLGNIEKVVFYLDDTEEGFIEYYHPNGKINYEEQMKNGWFTRIIQFDTLGKEVENKYFDKGVGSYNLRNLNGTIKSSGNVKNSYIEGIYKNYFSNKQLQVERFYKNGFADSTYKLYYLDGKLNMVGNFLLGDKHGTWKTYFANGKLSNEELFEYGNLNGLSKVYHEYDGNIQKEIEYKNGEVHGTYKQFGESGNLAYVLYFDDGYLISYSYEGKDGKLVTPIELKNATGKLTAYYKNGNKSAEIEYDDNVVNGTRNLYFSSGKPYIISERAFGEETKIKKVYYPNGNTESEENHFQDELHGICKYYYLNGKVKAEENYYLGTLHGTCKYYDELTGKQSVRIYFYGELL